jgi:WD40 repeat protein
VAYAVQPDGSSWSLEALELGSPSMLDFALAPTGLGLPDRLAVSLDSSTGNLALLDPGTGSPLAQFTHPEGAATVACLPGCTTLISGGASGGASGSLLAWDTRDPQAAPRSLEGHLGAITALAVSPDGRWLASASADQTIRLWDTNTWQTVHLLRGHDVGAAALAFSPDGQLLASAAPDARLRVWEIVSGGLLVTFHAPTGFSAVTFSPQGKLIAAASRDEVFFYGLK